MMVPLFEPHGCVGQTESPGVEHTEEGKEEKKMGAAPL